MPLEFTTIVFVLCALALALGIVGFISMISESRYPYSNEEWYVDDFEEEDDDDFDEDDCDEDCDCCEECDGDDEEKYF